MEVKLINVSIKNKNKYLIKDLNLTLNKNKIIGIYNDNLKIINNLIFLNVEYTGNILVDNKLIKPYTKKKFSYIESEPFFLTEKVSDEFYLIKKNLNDSSKKYIEKIESLLNMVGLSKEYLERKINTLSKSEKKLIQFALGLITNPELIILENPFVYLDDKNKRRIEKILIELKKEYNKMIILYDNDINNLYELVDQIIIFKDNQLLINGDSDTVFKDLKLLEENEIEFPDAIKFIFDAEKLGKEITHSNDLKTILKDVCQYVKESN